VQLVDQTTGYFHFAGHFRRPSELVQRSLLFDYTLDSSTNPFRMGLAQALGILGGLVGLALGWRRASRFERTGGMLAVLCLAASTFLMMPVSRPVWDHVPLLDYTQFPWRWLSFQALFGALLVGWIPQSMGDTGKSRRARPASIGLAAGLAVFLGATSLAGLHVDRLALTEADVTPFRLMLYEAYSGNLGGTIRYEFLPAEMKPRPYTSAALIEGGGHPAPLALTGRLRQALLEAYRAQEQTWRLTMDEAGWVTFHLASFPGWTGTLDGQPQGVRGVPGLGLLQMEVPAGEHVVTLRLDRTRVERWSERASLVAVLMLGLLGVVAVGRQRDALWTALRVATLVLAVATWLVLAGPVEPQTIADGPLVMDYVRSPYLHRLPGGVRMGPASLLHYSFDRDVVAPGEMVQVSTEWRDVPPGATLRLEMVALTAHLVAGSPAWAVAEAPVADGDAGLALLLPPRLPPGLYALRPTLLVDGVPQEAATAEGVALGLLALQPIRVLDVAARTDPPAVLARFGPPDGTPEITLREVQTAWVSERLLQVDMLWHSERQAARNYQLSVRLKGPDGSQIVARDLPPLAGNYPTSLWQACHLYPDSLRIALPDDARPSSVTDVEIVLYDGQTLAAIGSVAVPLQ